MAIDIKNAFAEGVKSFVGTLKTFALPLAIGTLTITVIVGIVPQAKKFLQ